MLEAPGQERLLSPDLGHSKLVKRGISRIVRDSGRDKILLRFRVRRPEGADRASEGHWLYLPCRGLKVPR